MFGVGGAGGNATNNMIKAKLQGANFVVVNVYQIIGENCCNNICKT